MACENLQFTKLEGELKPVSLTKEALDMNSPEPSGALCSQPSSGRMRLLEAAKYDPPVCGGYSPLGEVTGWLQAAADR